MIARLIACTIALALASTADAKTFWALTTRDAEASAAWYTRALDLEITHRLPPPADAQAVLIVDGPLAMIEIAGRAEAPRVEGPTFAHQGIWKAGIFVDDLDAWVTRWRERGIAFNGPIEASGMRFVLLTDPDNNRIQVFERVGTQEE